MMTRIPVFSGMGLLLVLINLGLLAYLFTLIARAAAALEKIARVLEAKGSAGQERSTGE